MDTVVDLDEEALMSRMISLLLNYPSIAYENDTVEVRVRKIEKSQVLLELIHLAEMDEDISQDDLIKPFQSKSGIYNRLKELCTLVPYLSETQARNEFLSALTAAEQHQKNAQIKAALASLGIDNPTEEQLKIMKGIQKGTYNNIEDEEEYAEQLKIMEGIQKGTYNNIEDELVEPDEPPIPDFSDEPDEPEQILIRSTDISDCCAYFIIEGTNICGSCKQPCNPVRDKLSEFFETPLGFVVGIFVTIATYIYKAVIEPVLFIFGIIKK
jgi:hypothetical protein